MGCIYNNTRIASATVAREFRAAVERDVSI